MFSFSGNIDNSKSWMNRALILQSYFSLVQISGTSSSDDVLFLQKALADLQLGKNQFYAGLGGTTFRFLVLRLSRLKGEFLIQAHPQLLKRPQSELENLLQQLSVRFEWIYENGRDRSGLKIISEGWQKPTTPLFVSAKDSSQFLSAVVLNCLDLDFSFLIQISSEFKSESYFQYTLDLLSKCGIEIQYKNREIRILENLGQHLRQKSMLLQGEVDVSSFFSLAAAAVLNGRVHLKNWNSQSLQPDMAFRGLFKKMKIDYNETDSEFKIEKQSQFLGLNADVSMCPDLVPVLSVLCAFANGQSSLYGAEHLKHKESNRIQKSAELLRKIGIEVEEKPDGLVILGQPRLQLNKIPLFSFDPEHDHRMAMAAAILKMNGANIDLKHPEVIQKSYPQFYDHIELK